MALLSPDERTLQLKAWLTLASSDDTSFVGATTQAVAGRVNREGVDVPAVESPPLRLQCWPEGTTSGVPGVQGYAAGDAIPPTPPPTPPAAPVALAQRSEIIVTGSRVTAARERLGDLQLYRIPEPVTVAANAHKQVGLLDRPAVRVEPVYRMLVVAADAEGDVPAVLTLRSRNREDQGLGLPLPAGNMVLFREGAGRPLLIGETRVDDTAVGEKVELALAGASGVRARLTSQNERRRTITLTNDRPVAVTAEVELMLDNDQRLSGARLVRRYGKALWPVTIPANGTATLTYRIEP